MTLLFGLNVAFFEISRGALFNVSSEDYFFHCNHWLEIVQQVLNRRLQNTEVFLIAKLSGGLFNSGSLPSRVEQKFLASVLSGCSNPESFIRTNFFRCINYLISVRFYVGALFLNFRWRLASFGYLIVPFWDQRLLCFLFWIFLRSFILKLALTTDLFSASRSFSEVLCFLQVLWFPKILIWSFALESR